MEGNFDTKGQDGKHIVQRNLTEATSWKEVAQGIYLPQKITHTKYANGQVIETTNVVFNSIKVNQSVDPLVFVPKYDNGTKVRYRILGKEYTVDAAGNKIGIVSDLKTPRVGPVGGPGESVTVQHES